jgi:hypothetical protein
MLPYLGVSEYVVLKCLAAWELGDVKIAVLE